MTLLTQREQSNVHHLTHAKSTTIPTALPTRLAEYSGITCICVCSISIVIKASPTLTKLVAQISKERTEANGIINNLPHTQKNSMHSKTYKTSKKTKVQNVVNAKLKSNIVISAKIAQNTREVMVANSVTQNNAKIMKFL